MNRIKHLLLSAFVLACASVTHANIVLKDTHGQTTSFSALKGKWVLINYWAGWCQTCVDEIPEFNRFYTQHKNDKDPIALFAVNFDQLPAFEQQNLIRKLNISYPNLLDNPAEALNLGDITGVPVTFIFNPEGQLVKTLYGGQTARSLNKALVM